MEKNKIDLRECTPGDILISSLGAKLRYVKPLSPDNYMDHEVEYLEPNKGNGTRTHEGYVFRKIRKPEFDHDIVKIIKKNIEEEKTLEGKVLDVINWAKSDLSQELNPKMGKTSTPYRRDKMKFLYKLISMLK